MCAIEIRRDQFPLQIHSLSFLPCQNKNRSVSPIWVMVFPVTAITSTKLSASVPVRILPLERMSVGNVVDSLPRKMRRFRKDLKVEVLKKGAPKLSGSPFYRCVAEALSSPAFGKIGSKINSISNNRPPISVS